MFKLFPDDLLMIKLCKWIIPESNVEGIFIFFLYIVYDFLVVEISLITSLSNVFLKTFLKIFASLKNVQIKILPTQES